MHRVLVLGKYQNYNLDVKGFIFILFLFLFLVLFLVIYFFLFFISVLEVLSGIQRSENQSLVIPVTIL